MYQNNLALVQIFYWIPHFPTTVLLSDLIEGDLVGDLNIPFAWISLILNIPLYFGLYTYLD